MIKKPQPVTQPVTQHKPVTDFSIKKILYIYRNPLNIINSHYKRN